ncbi:tomoregulin-2a isoform X2 [Callorhinchus milii]|uniref:tomoregulin-2a isoform X2 n=1 Tax=Callorhinchus milii TaxID=7868 RepID=UPI001C3FBE9F|nr:tomoregulin-2a isoform X2 [Callorhinchus milii]
MVEVHQRCWTLLNYLSVVLFPAMLTFSTLPVKLSAFPASLSDCQTPTGWNCSGFDDREHDLFLCDTNTCQFGGECLRIGQTITCDCQFKCNTDYVPMCGSNGNTYENECYLRQAACKQQSEIKLLGEGSCTHDMGSGSGDGGNEGSGETIQKKTSSCDICQFGAECDEDAEDVWCVCNIDCSRISFNQVCASDGKSYNNPCQVKDASCQTQEFIEVKHLGRCPENVTVSTKSEDVLFARTDYTEETANKLEETARFTPCPKPLATYCLHGKCEYGIHKQEPICRCEADFKGPRCEQREFNVLKCPRGNRIQRQKQNSIHYSSDNTTRASTRLI